jgi:hypothetical protein
MWDCPHCEGKGNIVLIGGIGVPCPRLNFQNIKQLWCPFCDGSGSITLEQMKTIEYGERVRDYRVYVLKLGLREYSISASVCPSEQSYFETGRLQHLNSEKLEVFKNRWEAILGDRLCST